MVKAIAGRTAATPIPTLILSFKLINDAVADVVEFPASPEPKVDVAIEGND